MAHGLSLLVQVKGLGEGADAVSAVMAPLDPADTTAGPNILHYVWAVPVPNQNDPPGVTSLLLTTVYDEDFDSYIRDLVLANPDPFNEAAKVIVGLEGLIPVQDNLSQFIEFVRDHDLTRGGTLPFTEAYPYTVVQIENCFSDA
ncbi:MAG TPA: hypothetical protein VK614_06520 [Allosphingosinicella sp.]|nr:hypothetical protein [Allosphingosinicella sp.]